MNYQIAFISWFELLARPPAEQWMLWFLVFWTVNQVAIHEEISNAPYLTLWLQQASSVWRCILLKVFMCSSTHPAVSKPNPQISSGISWSLIIRILKSKSGTFNALGVWLDTGLFGSSSNPQHTHSNSMLALTDTLGIGRETSVAKVQERIHVILQWQSSQKVGSC